MNNSTSQEKKTLEEKKIKLYILELLTAFFLLQQAPYFNFVLNSANM